MKCKAFTREKPMARIFWNFAVSIGASGWRQGILRRKARSLCAINCARLVNIIRPPLAVSAADDPDVKRQLASLDQRILRLEESLQSAEVIPPHEGKTDTVRFGATVIVREMNGEESTYRIVGVDEIDLDHGWVSWLSPIARALINAKVGERVRFKVPSGETELEILALENYD